MAMKKLGGHRYVPHLDYGDGFMSTPCQSLPRCTLSVCAVCQLYLNQAVYKDTYHFLIQSLESKTAKSFMMFGAKEEILWYQVETHSWQNRNR